MRGLPPVQVLRIFLTLLAMFFAYALGRMGTRLHLAGKPKTKALTWVLRVVVCVMGVAWPVRGHADLTLIVACVLVVLALGAGIYIEMRPRQVEEVHLFDNGSR